VITKLRERLVVSKKAAQRFDMDRFNLKKVSELETVSDRDLKPVCNFGELK